MTYSPLLNYVLPDKKRQIDITNKVSDFIAHDKTWKSKKLSYFVLQDIIYKINNNHIPITNIKSATWATNTDIPSHPKAKCSNDL